jgi:dimethylhistidine N-methyltransferase
MWPAGKHARRRARSDAGPDEDEAFAAAVIGGLSAPQKTLPCSYFYDERGSALFEQITALPEYYLTRTETGILETHVAEIAGGGGEGQVLVEFGSGSSRKTEILLEAMPDIIAYVPIDVSDSALDEARRRLAARFPELDIRPIHGNFSETLKLPSDLRFNRKTGFFPGSTIGNLDEADARSLLQSFRRILSPRGRLIVGVDLLKSEETLLLAYDDPGGVTAAFNLNVLARINRAFGHAFALDGFRHEARFNGGEGRIEMHLVSTRDQSIDLLGRQFAFRRGETIHTENSHKYTIDGFRALARSAGWLPERVWTDAGNLFSVHELAELRGSAD